MVDTLNIFLPFDEDGHQPFIRGTYTVGTPPAFWQHLIRRLEPISVWPGHTLDGRSYVARQPHLNDVHQRVPYYFCRFQFFAAACSEWN